MQGSHAINVAGQSVVEILKRLLLLFPGQARALRHVWIGIIVQAQVMLPKEMMSILSTLTSRELFLMTKLCIKSFKFLLGTFKGVTECYLLQGNIHIDIWTGKKYLLSFRRLRNSITELYNI